MYPKVKNFSPSKLIDFHTPNFSKNVRLYIRIPKSLKNTKIYLPLIDQHFTNKKAPTIVEASVTPSGSHLPHSQL